MNHAEVNPANHNIPDTACKDITLILRGGGGGPRGVYVNSMGNNIPGHEYLTTKETL